MTIDKLRLPITQRRFKDFPATRMTCSKTLKIFSVIKANGGITSVINRQGIKRVVTTGIKTKLDT